MEGVKSGMEESVGRKVREEGEKGGENKRRGWNELEVSQ